MTSLKIRAKALLELRRRKESNSTVVGVVSPTNGHTHSIKSINGKWQVTTDEPEMFLSEKIVKALCSSKRYVVLYGGRGSAKSIGGVDISMIDAKDNNNKTYFLREFQSSIKTSVHSLIKSEINRLEFNDFEPMAQTIKYKGEDIFEFAGLARNTSSIKSSHGFKRYLVEEAEFLSTESLEKLMPTARNEARKGLPLSPDDLEKEKEKSTESNVSMMFILNPQSSQDPICKRFIVPYLDKLDADGAYEDDMHLIIKINHCDNPWFMESGLEQERRQAYETLDRSLADHIWLGEFNDHVENSIIKAEWFDACIDAHVKLGFEPNGAVIAAHDVADVGSDSKSYVMRHGVVVLDIQERFDGDGNECGHWAAGLANAHNADFFTWDCDGMGCLLNEQMSNDFNGKKTRLAQFKGSETADNSEQVYKPAIKALIQNQTKVKDALKNKRAQYYAELRDRIYRTYRAVEHNEYTDPDTLISFSSDILILSKLRSELCRMPIKPNSSGKLELFTKQEMKSKFKFASPNLADAVMMSMRFISAQQVVNKPYIPKRIKTMGAKR